MFEIKAKDKMVERALLIGAYTEAGKKAEALSLLEELEERALPVSSPPEAVLGSSISISTPTSTCPRAWSRGRSTGWGWRICWAKQGRRRN